MEVWIAIGLGVFIGVLLIFGNSKWAKAHISYSIRRWISVDGFNEGKVRGFSEMSEKIDKRKRK